MEGILVVVVFIVFTSPANRIIEGIIYLADSQKVDVVRGV